MPTDDEIRKQLSEMGKDALNTSGEKEQNERREKQKDLAQDALGNSSAKIPIIPKPKGVSRLTRFYSLVGAFFIGTIVFFVLVSSAADFMETHSVFTDALVRIVVSIIGGITSVLIELIRTRQK